jgi:hypothetical protein
MEKPPVAVSEEEVETTDEGINAKTLILVAVLAPGNWSEFLNMLTLV